MGNLFFFFFLGWRHTHAREGAGTNPSGKCTEIFLLNINFEIAHSGNNKYFISEINVLLGFCSFSVKTAFDRWLSALQSNCGATGIWWSFGSPVWWAAWKSIAGLLGCQLAFTGRWSGSLEILEITGSGKSLLLRSRFPGLPVYWSVVV